MAALNRSSDQILRAVEAIAQEMVAFLQGFVRIPTVNPPGDEYTAGAEFMGRQLKLFGYDVEYIAAEGRPEHSSLHPRLNVLGRLPGLARPTRPTLHFNGHFDVVPAGAGWTVDPFEIGRAHV